MPEYEYASPMPSGTTDMADDTDADALPSPDGDECRVLVHGLRSRDIREGLGLRVKARQGESRQGRMKQNGSGKPRGAFGGRVRPNGE